MNNFLLLVPRSLVFYVSLAHVFPAGRCVSSEEPCLCVSVNARKRNTEDRFASVSARLSRHFYSFFLFIFFYIVMKDTFWKAEVLGPVFMTPDIHVGVFTAMSDSSFVAFWVFMAEIPATLDLWYKRGLLKWAATAAVGPRRADVEVLHQWKTSHLMTVQVWVTCASTVCWHRGKNDSLVFFAKGDLKQENFMELPVVVFKVIVRTFLKNSN